MKGTDMNALTTIDPAEHAKLAAALGATQDAGDRLPRLKIQTKPPVNSAGKKVHEKVGHFVITDAEEPVYAASVNIRILSQMF